MLGPAQDHVFLIMEVRRPPLTTYMHKGSLEAKGELCQGIFYPDTFSVKFMLRDPCSHMWGSWDIWNMDCEPGKLKWLTKGILEEIPHESNSNCHKCVTQLPSLSLSPPMCLSICTAQFFPLYKYCTWFTTFCLCGNYFLQSQKAIALDWSLV